LTVCKIVISDEHSIESNFLNILFKYVVVNAVLITGFIRNGN